MVLCYYSRGREQYGWTLGKGQRFKTHIEGMKSSWPNFFVEGRISRNLWFRDTWDRIQINWFNHFKLSGMTLTRFDLVISLDKVRLRKKLYSHGNSSITVICGHPDSRKYRQIFTFSILKTTICTFRPVFIRIFLSGNVDFSIIYAGILANFLSLQFQTRLLKILHQKTRIFGWKPKFESVLTNFYSKLIILSPKTV